MWQLYKDNAHLVRFGCVVGGAHGDDVFLEHRVITGGRLAFSKGNLKMYLTFVICTSPLLYVPLVGDALNISHWKTTCVQIYLRLHKYI